MILWGVLIIMGCIDHEVTEPPKQKIHGFEISHINSLTAFVEVCRLASCKRCSAVAHLADVLAEGGVGNHLAQEVEVRCHQRHDAAADEHGHVLLVGQSHVLQRVTEAISC